MNICLKVKIGYTVLNKYNVMIFITQVHIHSFYNKFG